ncbi:hypothetical protein [Microbacterium arborescens]|uniref:hypothetical protein n=1 Tax=Microbacterium arborescens TaxID=33883 RepID=UPI0025A114BF|nr:hypothetical protein [Microbacterium arborescens]WJM15520.1 hypothetical protein QUC20_14775 [Microbacterium arborescens]
MLIMFCFSEGVSKRDLFKSRLSEEPPRAFNASQIRTIDTTAITGIQDALRNMPQIRTIDTTAITGIQDALRNMPQIRTIDTTAITGIQDALHAYTSWVRSIDTSWFDGLSRLAHQRVRALPPNWAHVSSGERLDDDKLRLILLVDGIALAWVPRSALVERLLAADDSEERREIVRSGCNEILSDCIRASNELPSREGRAHARFVSLSASAIRGGHHQAAQALSANLIDTLGRSYMKPHAAGHKWSLVTAKNRRPELSKLGLRALMVLGPLAVSHTDYCEGDSIPRTFSRHATAHAVSSRQYTKVNSLIALMNATAFLCWLERDTDAFAPS